MNKQKVIGLILGVVLFIALIAGLTYAYISWNSDNINLKVNSECFNILYDGGTSINGSIMPSVDYTGGRHVTVKMDLSSACTLVEANGKIYLTTSNSTSSNLYEEGVLNYQLLINDEVTDIKGSITESGTIEIDVGQLNKNSVATTTYTVYVWVNGEYVTNEHASSTYYGNISAKAVQQIFEVYDYTGGVQVVNITQTGTYKLEVWGAQGGYGYNETYHGGYGGYSRGYVSLDAGDTLYVYVGGKGSDATGITSSLLSGGFNGGGAGYGSTNKYTGSGGGATHIALSSGLLSTLSGNVDDILIVAGGGGSASYESNTYNSIGGNAGGYIGNDGSDVSESWEISATGGTQNSGGTGLFLGTFGQGASSDGSSTSTGGGGGFYGGGAGKYASSGGGGSGYIGNPLLINKIMYCYECKDSSEEADETNIKTRSTIDVNLEAISNSAKIGNGYARITYIS